MRKLNVHIFDVSIRTHQSCLPTILSVSLRILMYVEPLILFYLDADVVTTIVKKH